MGTQLFCLKWNNHQSNLLSVFEHLLRNEAFVDVTLACEGLSIKAHKMILSACSPYFQDLFLDNPCKHPIVILKDMKFIELRSIIDFMYKGEINVSQDQLAALLKTAEVLRIKGLADVTQTDPAETSPSVTPCGLPVMQDNFSPEVPVTTPVVMNSDRALQSPKKKKRHSTNSYACDDRQWAANTSSPPSSPSPISSPKKVTGTSSKSSKQISKKDLISEMDGNDEQDDSTAGELSDSAEEESSEKSVNPQDVALSNIHGHGQEHIFTKRTKKAVSFKASETSRSSGDHAKFDRSLSIDDAISEQQALELEHAHFKVENGSDAMETSPSTSSGNLPKKKSKKSAWTVQDLMKAIHAVRSGQMNVLRAALTFGIPKSSLYDYISGRTGVRLRLVKKIQPNYPLVTITQLPSHPTQESGTSSNIQSLKTERS